jgi:hypothetical protein
MFLFAVAESENHISEVHVAVRYFTSQDCILLQLKKKWNAYVD